MSDVVLEQVVELALRLSDAEQEILMARLAEHLAQKRDAMLEHMAGRTYEVWSPQVEGGAIAVLNQALLRR